MEIFQQKHITGWLPWRKVVYYKYFKYVEGVMMQISIIGEETIKDLEQGK